MEGFLPEILATRRMFLYAYDEEWAPEVRDFLERNRAYFQRRETAHTPDYYEVSQIAGRMQAARRQMADGNGVTYYGCLKERPGRIVLNVLLTTAEVEGVRFGSLGYRMDQAHTGQGLMTEALNRLIALGFEMLQYDFIEAIIARDNPASQRVAEKLGFVRLSAPDLMLEAGGQLTPHARHRRYPDTVFTPL